MSCDTTITLLDDYVDGLLSEEQAAEVEAHLEGCASCQRELSELHSLLEQAAALPADITPERDLWGGIAAQIASNEEADRHIPLTRPSGPPSVRQASGLPAHLRSPPRGEGSRERAWYANPRVLALAAALLVGSTVAVTRMLAPEAPAPSVAEAPAPQEPAPLPLPAWEQEMTTASTALSGTLDQRRADLQPETVAIIEENLHIIDTAIEDCRAALAADPANAQLESAMLSAWQHKVQLLERATTLPPNS